MRGRRCSLKSWVFKSFLKIDRQTDRVVVVVGKSFHHRGTTHEKSLDCLECGVGSAR